jgi:2-keto-3-deoxy-L-rhamnonate aldolase RhmA
MDTESLRTRLRSREPLFGLALNYPAPGIIEGMCRQWDFVWIDGQHGQFAYDSALAAVQTMT